MTPEHTDMTRAARLREALEGMLHDVASAIGRLRLATPTTADDDQRRDMELIVAACKRAREALAAVPEAPESPDDLLTVTLRRGQWTVLLSAASDYGKRVPLEQGDGGACLDAIREALGERVEEGTGT